jgi:general secretion pathway protein M
MIRDWWEQLAPRERMMVMVCAAFIILTLIWTMAIRPLYSGSAQLQEDVADKQAQLANLQELASQALPGRQGQAGGLQGGSDSIVVIIDRTTRERALADFLTRNQPEGESGVRLRFENAPFDPLVEWLGELNQSYGMVTVSANFDDAGAGRVNCNLVLERPGS